MEIVRRSARMYCEEADCYYHLVLVEDEGRYVLSTLNSGSETPDAPIWVRLTRHEADRDFDRELQAIAEAIVQ